MLLYKAKKFELIKERISLPNGSSTEAEYIKHNGATTIIPLIGGKVIMERQYRYVIRRYVYELPAGTIKEGERPVECARRELKEETGYVARSMKELFWSYSTPGISTEKIYFFLAKGLKKEKKSLEKNEIITTRAFRIEEAISMIKSGKIVDGKTIQGLLFFNFL
ncbi:MAG: NUDIX hydrolase [Candidatus Micrarchaeaceae archaeon]